MIKRVIVPLIILLSVNVVFSQEKFNSIAYYEVKFQLDSTDNKSTRTEYAELLLGDSASLFQSINFGKIDSISQSNIKRGVAYGESMRDATRFWSDLMFRIVKTATHLDHYEKLPNADYPDFFKSTESKIANDQWKLFDELEHHSGLLCQRAQIFFGGRVWNAWFAIDIVVDDGPYKFCGLPGLIVEIEDDSKTWSFSMVDFIPHSVKKVHIDDYPLIGTKIMSKSDFWKHKKYARDNTFELMFAAGNLNGVEPEVLEDLKLSWAKKAKKDNNWIELY